MDPTKVFCDNPDCSARGKCGEGTIKVHSHKEQRYRCTACGRTFAASKGSPFYRLHKDRFLFVCVITLLSHGCPPQAIVAAYGLDERTIADWHNKSGSHCQGIHDHHLNTKPLDLHHVQADELARQACRRPQLDGPGHGRAHAAVVGRRGQPYP